MKIGVLGASGYAGGELLRLLSGHPEFEVNYIAAGSNAGEKITDLHSHLIYLWRSEICWYRYWRNQ